ncbi:basic proline-rich protein-like [Moschus berezovskii]|uniref:basic proline-rich protein-like n=1 Tax=Moschus berezovskii TaxID=68408 RepID=UPI00244523EC|nr:basic proline-rich protein-like [Moschus berezovskii]
MTQLRPAAVKYISKEMKNASLPQSATKLQSLRKSSQRGHAQSGPREAFRFVSHRALSPRQLKEANAGRDPAVGGNFSASSAEPGSHCPGRSERESPRPPGRCAGPGSADAALGPGRGCAEEDAPPLRVWRSPPSPPPRAHRAPEKLPDSGWPPPPPPPRGSPAPGGVGRGRCLRVPLQRSAQTWACSAGAAGVPAPQLPSSPQGTYPAAAAAAPCLRRAVLRGKESERETAPAAAWLVPAPRPPSPCRRERAGSAGPLRSGPIGRGGPPGPGPVPPPRATPPPSNRRRRRPATPPPRPRRPRPQARAPCRCRAAPPARPGSR